MAHASNGTSDPVVTVEGKQSRSTPCDAAVSESETMRLAIWAKSPGVVLI